MIEGVEVLSTCQNYDWALLVIPILYLIISFLNIIIASREKRACRFVIFCVAVFFCVILFFKFFNSNHIEYKVTINDDVPFTEFTEKYEILEKNGNIYTIKEIAESEEAQ